jgi:hypothetical protein
MDDQIEALGTEKSFEGDAVADVGIVVSEVLANAAKALEVPGGVAGFAKENAAHVVVQAVDRVALTLKVLDRFRADQAAGAGDENEFGSHRMTIIFRENESV